jgi:hypothetical protein
MRKLTASPRACALILTLLLCAGVGLEAAGRSRSGLQALYDFSEPGGALVKDVSGAGQPVDLRIGDTNAVRWTDGGLEVTGRTLIRSPRSATRISDSIRVSGKFTVEAWLRPAAVDQSGPARIITLSPNGSQRNFTLGQDGTKFDVRLRTTQTTDNGIPSTSSPERSLTTNLTHVVFTRDRNGRTRLYLDGKLSVERTLDGTTVNWDGSYSLALANEFSNDRPWRGTYHLVALFNRDLLPHEVEQHYQAGPSAGSTPSLAGQTSAEELANARLFEAEIAPLLSRNCLECHDSAIRKGKLDLSQRHTAFAGSSSGPVIEPGDAAKSVLWTSVEADEMPEDRPPLSAREKALLKQWIEGGAVWPTEVIDPAAHRLSRQTGQSWLRRLTVPEFVETVRSAIGVEIEQEAGDTLPKDLRADGFSNTAYALGVDLSHVEAYAKMAEMVVGKLDVPAFLKEFNVKPDPNPDGIRKSIARIGHWLLRGPLEDHEVNAFLNVASSVTAQDGDFNTALAFVIEAMLQSPRFIYRVENQRGDGRAWPVGDYELASRLSYTLWGGPPDRELMRAADAGELYDRRNVEKQVNRMLADPRVVKKSLRFVTEWLDLDRLANLRPNPDKFPQWDAALAADMRAETLAFFEDVVWRQKRPLADLLNAKVTYATPRLAKFYGLPESDSVALTRYDLGTVPERGGLLTQGSVLTVGGDEASMVARGLFVLNDILRGAVNNPPPGLDTRPVPTKPGLSKRGAAQQRIDNPTCGACHVRFETLAFALEKYDGVGAFHQRDEHGNELREDGEVLFPGEAEPVSFKTAGELMNLLAGHDRVRENLTRKVIQFAIGRPLTAADAPLVTRIHQTAEAAGGTYSELMRAIALSDLVLTTQTEAN